MKAQMQQDEFLAALPVPSRPSAIRKESTWAYSQVVDWSIRADCSGRITRYPDKALAGGLRTILTGEPDLREALP
jgi:hypothetical protein